MSIQNIERMLAVASAISCIISAGIMCQQLLEPRLDAQLEAMKICLDTI